MSNSIESISKYLDKAFEEADKEFEEKIKPQIEVAKKSIKHPFFNYAILNSDTFEITYKRKSFTEFFRTFGKRICRLTIKKLVAPELTEYKPMRGAIRYGNNNNISKNTK